MRESQVKQSPRLQIKFALQPTYSARYGRSFNAFEFAYPEIFANDAFFWLDMGHLQSTVLIGSKGDLVLVRSIDYGARP